MPLTIRLGPALDAALKRYCSEHAVTKSLVVQESLATYLVQAPARAGAPAKAHGKAGAARPMPSPAYRAFERAGLIGAGSAGGMSADKAAVRRRVIGA